jgi:DNA-binding GntR family transcriptional regulator
MAPRRIEHGPLVFDTVHAELRNAILDGQLAPGTALSVPALAREFGLSRTPVREAVAQLVTEGLAHSQPHRGAVVASFTPRELNELYIVREGLEGVAARLAAEQRNATVEAELDKLLAVQVRSQRKGDERSFVESSFAFHTLIANASANATLFSLIDALQNRTRLAMQHGSTVAGHMSEGALEHRHILDAIRLGDGAAAEESMRHHLRCTLTRLCVCSPPGE